MTTSPKFGNQKPSLVLCNASNPALGVVHLCYFIRHSYDQEIPNEQYQHTLHSKHTETLSSVLCTLHALH